MRIIKTLIVLFVIIFISTPKVFAQIPLSDNATISLLTCGPGDELYSVFGHTALRVNDPARGVDEVYNYGTFDFAAPNFYLKFVKGDLQYFVSVSSYADFVYTYKYFDRDVYEQQLNLTTAQKQKIYNELREVLNSDRKFYTYKFIERNCTTMAGDVIELGLGSAISKKNTDNGKTYRRIICEYLEHHYFENLGISLIFGAKTDKELDEPFLPEHLMQGAANTTTAQGPLAQPTVTVNKSQNLSAGTSLWNNIYFFSVLILLLAFFAKNKNVYIPVLVIAGFLGVFFCVIGFYSFHDEISANYNALLINPLFLLLVFFLIRNNQKSILWTIYLSLGMILIYIIYMLNKPHLIIVLPLIVLILTVLIQLLRKHKKAIA